jgi:hypothetical protein
MASDDDLSRARHVLSQARTSVEEDQLRRTRLAALAASAARPSLLRRRPSPRAHRPSPPPVTPARVTPRGARSVLWHEPAWRDAGRADASLAEAEESSPASDGADGARVLLPRLLLTTGAQDTVPLRKAAAAYAASFREVLRVEHPGGHECAVVAGELQHACAELVSSELDQAAAWDLRR